MSQLLQPFARQLTGLPTIAYEFNGIDQYVTIPPWTPLGVNWSIVTPHGVRAFDTGFDQVLWRAGVNSPHVTYRLDGSPLESSYNDLDGNIIDVSILNQFFAGTVNTSTFTSSPTGVINENAGLQTANNEIAKSITADPVTNIASSITPAKFFKGVLFNIEFNDNNPIQNTWATTSDGNRLLSLTNQIVFPLQDLFQSIMSIISGPDPLTGFVDITGQRNGTTRLRIYGSTHALYPNQIGIQSSVVGEFRFQNGDIAEGQHFTLGLNNTGLGQVIMEIDGEPLLQLFAPATFSDTSLDQFNGALDVPLPTGWTLSAWTARNVTNGEEWVYKLDEETGDLAFNSGATQRVASSIIFDVDAVIGDGIRYGEIPLLTLATNNDFDVSFQWVLKKGESFDFLEGDDFSVIRYVGSNDSFFVSTAFGNAIQINNVFARTIDGYHVDILVTRRGTFIEVFVDGVSRGSVGTALLINEFNFVSIGSANNPLPFESAIQNLEITNRITLEKWVYPLNEGSGTIITETDHGADGFWTPDVDWHFFSSDFTGVWTDDQGKVFIPDNSRYYAFDDGAGGNIREAIGGHDGTLVNFDDQNWLEETTRVVDDTVEPTGYTLGLPLDNLRLAIDSVSAIDHYHQGLPFTANHRLAVALSQIPVRYGNGAAPFAANERLAVRSVSADHYVAGVPYSIDGAVCINDPNIPKDPNYIILDGANGTFIRQPAIDTTGTTIELVLRFRTHGPLALGNRFATQRDGNGSGHDWFVNNSQPNRQNIYNVESGSQLSDVDFPVPTDTGIWARVVAGPNGTDWYYSESTPQPNWILYSHKDTPFNVTNGGVPLTIGATQAGTNTLDADIYRYELRIDGVAKALFSAQLYDGTNLVPDPVSGQNWTLTGGWSVP